MAHDQSTLAGNNGQRWTLRDPAADHSNVPDSYDRVGDDSAKLSIPAVLHSPRPLLEERRRTAATSRSRRTTRSSSQRRRTQCSPPRSSSNQPPLQLSDPDLVKIARGAAAAIDWNALCARSSVWDKHKSLGDFGIYTRRCGRAYHVMASGSVACSVTEMYHVLCTTSSARYAAAMEELHGARFVSGEVVHRVNTHHHTGAGDAACPRDEGGRMFDLTVKTATFAKAHVLARDEHWCFLEFFQPQPDRKRFALTMHSLRADDVLAPRTPLSSSGKPQPNQLQELAAGYSVVADPRRGLVWVVFFAQFVEPAATSLGHKLGLFQREHASKGTVKARIMKMAKATCCLPMIVRRRRLGAQVFIESSAFAPPNTHCICCTAALPLLARKQRCHLCGYCVCAKCSSAQEIERAHTHLAPPPRRRPVVRVCFSCARRVHNANYDNIPGGLLSPSAVVRDPPGGLAPSKMLAGLLRDSFDVAKDDARKRALARVAALLLEQGGRPAPSSDDSAVVSALATDLRVREFALDECALGNALTRGYPIAYKSEQDDDVPGFPVPHRDGQRMSAARQQRLLAGLTNAPELEVICAIACKELECAAGLVTLVGQREVHVLAASGDAFRGYAIMAKLASTAARIMELHSKETEAVGGGAAHSLLRSARTERKKERWKKHSRTRPEVAGGSVSRSTQSNSATHARTSSFAASSSAPTASCRSQQPFAQHHQGRPLAAPLQLQLRVSDATLVQRVQRAASSIDWRALRDASASWGVKKRTGVVVGGGEFMVATHRQADDRHVMATGSLTCSVAEMAHILWTTRSERFLAAMSELHGAHFVSGAVVHKVDSYAALSRSGDTTTTTAATTAVSSSSGSDYDVSVKTATFAKVHMFARDEQWCYVDQFDMQADRSRFLLTMQSLRPDDVTPDAAASPTRAERSARSSLHDAVAGYSVVADPRGDFVWVAFYARCLGAASRSATKSRLMKMAAALCNLPAVVQRRRLGAQVFASPKALVKPPNNSHCKCCTAALTLLVSKKRCHLCGYRVCAKCSTKQQIERAHRRNSQMVRVCAKCTRRVNAANYDDLPTGLASPLAVKPDPAPPGQALAEYLRQSLESAADDAPRTRALVQVARSLLADDERALKESRQRAPSASPHGSVATGDSIGANENDLVAALERGLRVTPRALDDCRLAHADDTRTYALDYAGGGEGDDDDGVEGGGDTSGARYPLPDDERARTAFVQRLTDLADVPELEIICALASQELQCDAGLVTLVVGDSVHVVASNSRDFRGSQYAVMAKLAAIATRILETRGGQWATAA
ncbi:hypothetical protein PybrP1_012062 [[Pythium] brassicae (nom. inval.)]|nr:hypothetical protein PybrP1_012062 [[Pythium] brassicae (nom. inval.)]